MAESLSDYVGFEYFEYSGNDFTNTTSADSSKWYTNPIIAGFHPDPSICKVGNTYYLVNSSFCYFPGLPIFKSTDLINWQQIGHVIDRKEQADFSGKRLSAGMYAPTIRHHNGVFYVICTNVEGYGNFIVTTKDPKGPWSNPIVLPEVEGIDPDIFFDEDGKVYITHNGSPPNNISKHEGHRAIYMWEYDVANAKVVGEAKLVIDGGTNMAIKPVWIEGPHLLKKDGFYYLICAQGGTGYDHSEVVFRSKNVFGPYESYTENPILTQSHLDRNRKYPVTSTGHADFVQTQNGDWWAVFLGCRPYEKDWYNTGRETFLLPVSWNNGWPEIVGGKKAISQFAKRPNLVSSSGKFAPTSGNFVVRDEFDQEQLSYNWNFIRTPMQVWHKLTGGKMYIKARKETIGSETNASFIGRRQQHLNFTAETQLDFKPKTTTETVGMIAFQNEKNYLFLGVKLDEKKQKVVFLERISTENKQTDRGATALILKQNASIQLKIVGKGRYYDFYYKYQSDAKWTAVATRIDASILSTEKAGGFVGSYLAMYASSEHFTK